MDRFISTIISQFSNILGINGQENSVSGMAIRGSGLGWLLRSLGLRHGGGSRVAVSLVAVSRVSTATAAAAVDSHVYKPTCVSVPHCWRPAGMVRHDSGQIIS